MKNKIIFDKESVRSPGTREKLREMLEEAEIDFVVRYNPSKPATAEFPDVLVRHRRERGAYNLIPFGNSKFEVVDCRGRNIYQEIAPTVFKTGVVFHSPEKEGGRSCIFFTDERRIIYP